MRFTAIYPLVANIFGKVLKRAREVDPQGMRTLGVITKPDQLVRGTDGEKIFLSLARNEQVDFHLGWHVIRNLDSSDEHQDRDTVEARFLEESNFRCLPTAHLGIVHLRQRLSVVLFDQIKAELPRLIEDIEAGISGCRRALEKLGPARASLEEQQSFLLDLSDEFESLCEAAIAGRYEHPFFTDQSHFDRRLSAMIANKGFEFEEEIRTEGAQWKIVEFASKKRRNRTRAEAVEEVRKLLKKSRGREVSFQSTRLVGLLNQSVVATRATKSTSCGRSFPRVQSTLGKIGASVY